MVRREAADRARLENFCFKHIWCRLNHRDHFCSNRFRSMRLKKFLKGVGFECGQVIVRRPRKHLMRPRAFDIKMTKGVLE
jgi:hypothetical protein